MRLFGKRIGEVTGEDILRLVANVIPEGKSLDYKQELSLGQDKDRKDFLFDIAAFANSDGGILVVGIEEKKGSDGQSTNLPERLIGFIVPNEEKFKQSIEDLIYASIEPRIAGLEVRFLDVDGVRVLLVAVDRYLGLPHMVTFRASNKFYRRNTASKYLMDVNELAEVFERNVRFRDEVERFRRQRIDDVVGLGPNRGIDINTPFFLHVLPLGRLNRHAVDLAQHQLAEHCRMNMKPMFGSGWSHRFNIDGLLTHYPGSGLIHSYVQLFRSGAMEYYTTQLHLPPRDGEKVPTIGGGYVEKKCLEKITEAMKLLAHLGVEAPYVVQVTFLKMLGVIVEEHQWRHRAGAIDTSEVVLPTILVESAEADLAKTMKPAFDLLWQASGHSGSPWYDAQGNRRAQ